MRALLGDILKLQLGTVGWGLVVVGGVLVLSPGARRGLRRALIRGIVRLQSDSRWNSFREEIHTQLEARRAKSLPSSEALDRRGG